ncbi:MAG: hypothetical protein WD993_06890 [Thermoleophilaceae bacterium]
MPTRIRVLIAAAIALALPALIGAAPAAAGTYTVRQCDYASGNAHHDFRWQASGSPAPIQNPGSGCGEFGLAARNGHVGTEQTYPSGGYGGWFAYAPPGTAFTHFSGAFGTLSGCCINGMTTYAEATEHANGAGGRAYLFQGELGNESWYAPSGLRGPVGRSWSASASGFVARRVGFHLRCGPGFTCFQRKTGDLRLRARSFDFSLRDDVTPSVGPPGGTLLAGGWLRGTRTLTFSASDGGGGLTGVSASFDSGATLSSASACTTAGGRYARLTPCPLARSGTWTVDTAKLPDGGRTVTIRASDAGGAVAQQTRSFHVDNTAPAAPVEPVVAGGSSWRRANGFVLGWSNPGSQHAPIVKAHWRACPAGGGECIAGSRAATGVTATDPVALPRAGEWDVRAWLEDAAGNVDATTASAPRRLRYDPHLPALRFLPGDPAAPLRVAIEASDMSGVAAAAIELRRRGTSAWTGLAATRQGSRLTAQIDDSKLARGEYELRARAIDAAGNQAVVHDTNRYLPIRAETHLHAAVMARVARRPRGCGRTRCRRAAGRRCRRPRAPRCRRELVTVARQAARVRRGETVTVRGHLKTATGRALGGRRVAVELVSANGSVRLPDTHTDAAGGIAVVTTARRSAAVRLRFAGDGIALPSGHEVTLRVPAPVMIRASRRRVAAGRRVVFRGRVRGGAIPRSGKLVEVQARFRGRWRTISAVRSARSGRWRFAYRFNAAGRSARYRFRARVPAEGGYPFAPGRSRPVRILVRAR